MNGGGSVFTKIDPDQIAAPVGNDFGAPGFGADHSGSSQPIKLNQA
jgi:hypothetical protein